MTSARAAQPSYVVLPQSSQYTTVLAFLMAHFARIPASVWQQRIADGKVHWQDGTRITAHCAYQPTKRVYYYREVIAETKIPFQEKILYQDAEILIVYKPHFLPVTPSGNYVNECLVHRLRLATGIDTIVPAHRLDRETAGIMLMSLNPATRAAYHGLFKEKQITKIYQARAKLNAELLQLWQSKQLVLPISWTVKNNLKRGEPSFLMQVVAGEANSHSEISLISVDPQGIGLFELSPITGKTHQLRVHMQSLGMPLLNDRFYPQLQEKTADQFDQPLQLLAQQLRFIDPITATPHHWQCAGLLETASLNVDE